MASRQAALGWFGLARGARRAQEAAISGRCSELVGRGQLANLLADRAFRPTEDLPYLGGYAVACELSRQAVYWAALAHREAMGGGIAATSAALSADDFPALWSSLDPQLLERAAGSAERREIMRLALTGKSFVDFAELSKKAQTDQAARSHAFAARLLEPLVASQRQLERAWVRRVQLLLGAVAVVIALVLLFQFVKDRRELRMDMAPSASWTASSQYGAEYSCLSPAQSCANSPSLFFHTLEEKNPSIVFDLGGDRSLSGVVVENRRDCCFERALPLLVQVSLDNRHWRTVATRKADFTSWREHFPTVQARYVKLYVARNSMLHLARVRLLP